MKIRCNFCGSMIDETVKSCPHCGAPLSGANRTASEQPKTIDELKAWYEAHHLPPEEITRFFIGKNITEPKAFGIYKNEVGDCVVYKNKASGERAVRYQGSDEAYAVNELYQRLKAEIADQKGNNPKVNNTAQPAKKNRRTPIGCLVFLIFFIIAAIVEIFDTSVPNGYYNYQGQQYYRQGKAWYSYDAGTDDWIVTDPAAGVWDGIDKTNASDYRTYDHFGKDFESSNWYDAGSNSDDSSWDSDSDWDSGNDSWDSGGTDWNSDW